MDRKKIGKDWDVIIGKLLKSDEPSIRWKIRVKVLGEDPGSKSIVELQNEIRSSARVKALLSERAADGRIPFNLYKKWFGTHWVLSILADIGYPSGDKSLLPLSDHVLNGWLSSHHIDRVPVLQGRARRCASQESNALYSLLTLGLYDDRIDQLADNLIKWQWPDGGWNCDKNPDAINSSFHETVIGVRALSLHGRIRESKASTEAAHRAAEIFLKRKLFRKQSDGSVINEHFLKLHYPCYWHYDILFGLKVIAEANLLSDKRCEEALDYLESKRLPDGGFPAEEKYYNFGNKKTYNRSLVDWGGVSKRKTNQWVTADALYVLAKAGRIF